MRGVLYIVCLLLAGCRLPVADGKPGAQTAIYPVIPNKIVQSGDPMLVLENGKWLYQQQPFSGTIVSFFVPGKLKSRQSFYEGREEGFLYTYYEDGSKDTQRFYHRGEKDSVNTGWWPNGNLRFEYHFTNGVYEGDFKEWYENGQPLKHIVYDAGKEQKGRGWRINGKSYMSFEVRNGRMYGLVNPNLCYSLKNERGEYVKTTQ